MNLKSKPYSYALLGLLALGFLSCTGTNFFGEVGDKTTDEARFYSAKQYINAGNYAEAIAEFEGMSDTYLAEREVAVIYASAYGGLCGLNFLSFVTALEGMGDDNLFLFLMKTYQGAKASQIEHCKTAESIIQGISKLGSVRTTDENFLMLFLSFAKIGVILASSADADPVDGGVDSGFYACAAADISDDNIAEVGTAMVNIISSISAIGDDLEGVGEGELEDIESLLAALSDNYDICEDDPDGSGDCTNTEAEDFQDVISEAALRTFINEGDAIGIDSCEPLSSTDPHTFENCPCTASQ